MPGNWKANEGSSLDSTCCPGPCSARAALSLGSRRGGAREREKPCEQKGLLTNRGPSSPHAPGLGSDRPGTSSRHGCGEEEEASRSSPGWQGSPTGPGQSQGRARGEWTCGQRWREEISQRKMPLSYGRRPRAPSTPRVTQSSLTSRASGPAPLPVLTAACQKMPGKVQPHKEEAALFQVVVRGHSTTGRA